MQSSVKKLISLGLLDAGGIPTGQKPELFRSKQPKDTKTLLDHAKTMYFTDGATLVDQLDKHMLHVGPWDHRLMEIDKRARAAKYKVTAVAELVYDVTQTAKTWKLVGATLHQMIEWIEQAEARTNRASSFGLFRKMVRDYIKAAVRGSDRT